MLWRLYRKAQYLSLDIVLGVVILLRFFSSVLSVSPSVFVYFLLGASVWLIYTIDHIKDARGGNVATRGRYQFHLKNETTLKVVVLIVILVCVGMIFYVDRSIRVAGVVLAVFSVVYLLLQDILARNGLKEFYVAVVYSSGILLAPFSLAAVLRWDILTVLILLTFLNLILFSWFEKEEDRVDGFSSIATTLGDFTLQRVIYCTLSLGLALALLMDFSRVNLFFFIGFSAYYLIYTKDQWARKNNRYRTLGDGIFLVPTLFEWL